jgi:hypothetical protein
LSAFVRQKNGSWMLEKPSLFKEEELIRRAVQQFRALDRDVAVMGRSEAAYDALSMPPFWLINKRLIGRRVFAARTL